MRSSSKRVVSSSPSPRSVALSAELWPWADFGGDGHGSPGSGDLVVAGTREDAVEDAYRRGFAEGADGARSEARAALESAMRAAASVLEEVNASRDTWASQLKQNLATLSAGIAGVIVDQALNADPELFVELAEKVIVAFPVEEALRVRLHPADHATIISGQGAIRLTGDRTIRWMPDQYVVRGGCIVEGPDRIVDGRVDEALRRVIRALSDD